MKAEQFSSRELGSRASRQRLDESNNAYYCNVLDGLSLGYRRGKNSGSWVARMYLKDTGAYRFQTLDKANDVLEAVGMSFQQAKLAAQEWFTQCAHIEAGGAVTGAWTVSNMMDEYLKDRELYARKELPETRSTIERHIKPSLGDIPLSKLTHAKVKGWRDSIARSKPMVRGKAGVTDARREIDKDDPDVVRKRHATTNRIFTVLRAALNYAYKENKVVTKAAWERIKPFAQVDAAKVRYLTSEECMRLISVCPSDFMEIIRASLYSGLRYGEVAKLRVGDFDAFAKTIHVLKIQKGKGHQRHHPLAEEGVQFFQSVTTAKRADAIIFTHASGRHKGQPWERTQQKYWMHKCCKEAEIFPPVTFHIMRHSYASQLAMKGLPMSVIAKLLGHADTRMAEKHYAHLAPSYVADALQANQASYGFAASGEAVNDSSDSL